MKKKKNLIDNLKSIGFEEDITYKWIFLNNEKSIYIITKDGEVYSTNYNKTGETKKIKESINHAGYHVVLLHNKGKIYRKQIHRLVAEAFIPNPDNKPQVNHKLGDKNKNDVDSLEWCTEAENIEHAYKMGLRKVGEELYNATITNEIAENICKEITKNELTVKEISQKFNVNIDIVRDILRKKTWKHISCKYDFSNYNKKAKTGTKGESNNFAKINEETVMYICELIQKAELSLPEIAKKVNTSYRTVQNIYGGKCWKHISSKYDFSKYKKIKDKSRKNKEG